MARLRCSIFPGMGPLTLYNAGCAVELALLAPEMLELEEIHAASGGVMVAGAVLIALAVHRQRASASSASADPALEAALADVMVDCQAPVMSAWPWSTSIQDMINLAVAGFERHAVVFEALLQDSTMPAVWIHWLEPAGPSLATALLTAPARACEAPATTRRFAELLRRSASIPCVSPHGPFLDGLDIGPFELHTAKRRGYHRHPPLPPSVLLGERALVFTFPGCLCVLAYLLGRRTFRHGAEHTQQALRQGARQHSAYRLGAATIVTSSRTTRIRNALLLLAIWPLRAAETLRRAIWRAFAFLLALWSRRKR